MVMQQTVMELFDSSDTVLSRGESGEPRLVALGPNMRREKGGPENPGDEQLLGQLVWYSISDALRMTPETLRQAIAEAGMEPEYLLPRAPTASAALSRAAEAAEKRAVRLTHARDGSPIDDERYAGVHFDSTGRGNKQAVTVILDPEERRLSYEPFASADVEDGRLSVEGLLDGAELLPVETEALKVLRENFAFEKNRHDGEAVRRVVNRALNAARAIPLRNSGAMYFVNRGHAGEATNILAFVARVAETAGSSLSRQARTPRAMTVPLVDREEYREVIAESLDDFVEKESRALIQEMASLTKDGEPVTKKRAEKLFGRVRTLKQSVREYEELLETRATAAQANLDVASKKARALLGLVSGG